MPALWQSSQRPMYIRTVWVDGYRHAILNHDDPCYLRLSAKRRPHSTTSTQKHYAKSRRSDTNDSLEDCLRKLKLVVTNDIKADAGVEKLHLSDVNDSDDELGNPTQPLTEVDISQIENMKAIKSNRTARTDVKEDTELCDRVLKWLDLAGKVELLKEDNAERMAQPRHSWPELQRRNLHKSKTSADIKVRESKQTDRRELKIGPIDRHEIYVTTNTIENYARQSRNAKTRQDTKVRERKVKDTKTNIIETRLKVASERSEVAKQYAELVSKKLIPNTGKVKKQVHIFMPEALPKRNDSIVTSKQSLLTQY